jgi:hypothetical protein
MLYLCKLSNFRRKWMKYKNIIKLRLPEIQLLAFVLTQLKYSIVKDHDEPTILLFETLFCTWECFNMGTELPTKVMFGQTLVLMQMIFLNNVRNVGRLVLSRTSCLFPEMLQLIPFNLARAKCALCSACVSVLKCGSMIVPVPVLRKELVTERHC